MPPPLVASSSSVADVAGPVSPGPPQAPARSARASDDWRNPRLARNGFLWPTLLVVLFLAIFPLIASLGLAFSYFNFAPGGFEIRFAGLANFVALFNGSERTIFIGKMGSPTLLGWFVFLGGTLLLAWAWIKAARGGVRARGLISRAIGGVFAVTVLWLVTGTILGTDGRPGTLVVTLIYASVGTAFQYAIGLALAWLTSRRLAGQRFFRVVFLLPLTITPVGVAYMFRLLTDTARGPFAPIWNAAGLQNFSLLASPWGAITAVIIADVWQWIPFMYIVLLAALEGRDLEAEEAAIVDGASRQQTFRYITLPALIPVSATVILIRMIEAFKIIDLPNILTNGGPGTATVSVTLESFLNWRGFNLGLSAAVAYALLIFVTLIATYYGSLVIPRAHRAV